MCDKNRIKNFNKFLFIYQVKISSVKIDLDLYTTV